MNTEASKREGGRSDWVKDEEGWKSVVTTPDLPNWTPGDTVGELTGSMAYPEDLDSPSSDGTQDRLGRLTWRRAKDNHRGLGLKRVEHIRKRKPAQLEEQQDQKNRRRSPAKHIANPLAAKAGKPEYVASLGSDTRSISRPTVKSSGTYSDSEIEPELGIQYPKPIHTQWHPNDPTFTENAGAGDKVMRELRSRSGGRRPPASPPSSERDGKSSRSASRVREEDGAAFSTAAAVEQEHKERTERRETERKRLQKEHEEIKERMETERKRLQKQHEEWMETERKRLQKQNEEWMEKPKRLQKQHKEWMETERNRLRKRERPQPSFFLIHQIYLTSDRETYFREFYSNHCSSEDRSC
jgi:hypothetical protein